MQRGLQAWKGERETVRGVRKPSETRVKKGPPRGLTCVFSGLFVLSVYRTSLARESLLESQRGQRTCRETRLLPHCWATDPEQGLTVYPTFAEPQTPSSEKVSKGSQASHLLPNYVAFKHHTFPA